MLHCYVAKVSFLETQLPIGTFSHYILIFQTIVIRWTYFAGEEKGEYWRKDYWESILAERPITFQQRHLMRKTKKYRNLENTNSWTFNDRLLCGILHSHQIQTRDKCSGTVYFIIWKIIWRFVLIVLRFTWFQIHISKSLNSENQDSLSNTNNPS